MHSTINHDDVEFRMVLEHFDVIQGLAIDKNAVGIIANLYLAHFVGSHKQFRHAVGGGNERLMGGESEEFLKVSEISSI